MKEINNDDEMKKILLDILYYLDDICKKNNINYSLIGGSLIGAVRHNNIIPWDDDIDVILTPNNYSKLIEILKKSDNSRYKLLDYTTYNYNYPFPKLVDEKTYLKENNMEIINSYGVYLDIFKYNYISNKKNIQKNKYKKIMKLKRLIRWLNYESNSGNLKAKVQHFISKVIGKETVLKKYEKIFNLKEKTDFFISNWPAYGVEHEVQKAENLKEYTRIKFGDRKIMVFKEYDKILKTTFGDYMKLPPKEKQISNHDFKAYWRDKNE